MKSKLQDLTPKILRVTCETTTVISEPKIDRLKTANPLTAFGQVCIPSLETIFTSCLGRVSRLYDSTPHNNDVAASIIDDLEHKFVPPSKNALNLSKLETNEIRCTYIGYQY